MNFLFMLIILLILDYDLFITIFFNFYLQLSLQFYIAQQISQMSMLNSSQNQFNKFISDDKVDGTHSTQNFSKFCENCRLTKDQLQGEIFSLKDKAHQSFMQVIQVQQLHEEQLQLIKQQHQDEITALKEQISKLENHVTKTRQEIVSMQKNSKHHICEVQSPSFFIDNIDIINCQQQDGRESNLDESSYVQFNEFVSFKNISNNQKFVKNQAETFKQSTKQKQYQQKIAKLNLRIIELQSEVQSLWQTNQQLKKQSLKHENNAKIMKNNYDSLFKESKFMSDHIRQLSNDKFKLERKIKQLQKEIRDYKPRPELKRSMTFEHEPGAVKIKINGSGLFDTHQYDNVRNSLESSKDQKDSGEGKTFISHSNNFEKLIQAKSQNNLMTKSDTFNKIQDTKYLEQVRKSMPNYKKISHVPSFKKVNSANKNAKEQKQFLIVKNQDQKQSSNFIDDIYRELQEQANLASLKRIHGQQVNRKQMFKDHKKLSWQQKTS